MKKSNDYLRGIKVSLPVILGYLPVAIAYAVMASEAGLSILETIMMSVLVFAGGSQIMAVGLIQGGAGMLSIVVATCVFNLRHFIMGTYIMKKLGKTKVGEKLLTAHGITDEAFAIMSATPEQMCSVPFLLGIITITYGSWVVGTVIGAFLSLIIPPVVSNALGIALPALFIALLVPGIKKSFRLVILVIGTAIINSLLTWALPEDAQSWAMIISSLVGAFVGIFFVKDEEVESE